MYYNTYNYIYIYTLCVCIYKKHIYFTLKKGSTMNKDISNHFMYNYHHIFTLSDCLSWLQSSSRGK